MALQVDRLKGVYPFRVDSHKYLKTADSALFTLFNTIQNIENHTIFEKTI